MSAVLISPATLGDLVKRESDPDYTRESVTLKASTAYPLGAVLGRITADGKYTFSPAASTTGTEGAEIACAVLLHAVPASDTDTQAVVLARGQVIVADRALVGLILGLPRNMDGSEGPRAQSTRAFARNLERLTPLPISFWDERLSTVAAERALLEGDTSRKRRAEVIDQVAAGYILQGALDRLRFIG